MVMIDNHRAVFYGGRTKNGMSRRVFLLNLQKRVRHGHKGKAVSVCNLTHTVHLSLIGPDLDAVDSLPVQLSLLHY